MRFPCLTPLLGVVVTALLVPAVCPAADGGTAQGLTMEDAVRLALENNLSLEEARHGYKAAHWDLWSARASLLPSVRLSSTARRVDPDTYRRANASIEYIEGMTGVDVEPFLYETTYETGFVVTAPIWNGGRLWSAVGAAGAARDAAMLAYESRRLAVAVEAKAAYFDVLRAEALLSVSRTAAMSARADAEAAQRRFELGLVPRVEVLRWRVLAAEDEKALADAETAVTLSRTRLADVLGLPLDTWLELVEVSGSDLEEHYARLSWLTDESEVSEEQARGLLSSNPDYAAVRASTRISKSALGIARGAFLPSLNASGSYGWKADDDIEPDDETAWSVTVALDFPVFTGFKNLSDYHQAKREYLAAERRQDVAERSMVTGLRGAVSRLRSSARALRAAEEQLAQSEEHLRNMTTRHEQGMISDTELVDAVILNDRSRVGHVNALYDAFLAVADVDRMLGTRPETGAGD